jgi:predicted GIY-YIG superfamily endonuclease
MASQALGDTMHHVYLLRSLADPKQTYIGLTDDMRARLKSHNEGANFHTAKYRPWELICCITFQSRERAAAFEKYLKVGSGHAFASRHLW